MATVPARASTGMKWSVAITGAALLLIALELAFGPWAPWKQQPHQAEAPLRLPVGLSANYGEAIKAADLSILDARTRAEAQPSWVAYDMVALALLPKARLTGSYDDYAAVDAALKRAEALSPDGAGPDQRQAGFDLLMHRLAAAEKSLDRLDRYAIRAPNETIESEGMRGDIAFYRGDYAGADRHYDRGDAIARHSMDFRRGVKASYFGDFDKAAEYFTRSEHASRLPSREAVVTHELARGSVELRRGEWDKAAQHFARANRLFPGYWLVESHVAQSLALAGRTDEAIRRLEPVAARSNAPEAMDLLSALYRSRGDGVRSRQWADRAGAIWQSRLEQFPDAAYGHALEHELAFGTPQRALDLARRDYASRPHGATAIALGWAWLANNKPDEALRAIAPVLASDWKSADVHVVAAQAHALLGQGEEAEAEQKKALAINPHALDPAAALIWFGH